MAPKAARLALALRGSGHGGRRRGGRFDGWYPGEVALERRVVVLYGAGREARGDGHVRVADDPLADVGLGVLRALQALHIGRSVRQLWRLREDERASFGQVVG